MSHDITWRCEHPLNGDVKMAAKPDHKEKLEQEGYICEVYPDEVWTAANDNSS